MSTRQKTDKTKVLKTCFLGSSGVGKTCIVTRLLNKDFDQYSGSTMGASFTVKKYNINSDQIRLDIWDTAGQERFNALIKMYYRNVDLVIVVFDITNKDSFIRAQNLIKEVKACENPEFILLGNKFDLDCRQVTNEEAQSYADNNDVKFIEISAKSSYNLDKFDEAIIEIIKRNIYKNRQMNDFVSDNSLNINDSQNVDVNKKSKFRNLFWCFSTE